ncbi:fibroleukin-like isoform X1 [Varroa destructor]|uniref:Fibrinogen C-terminal domain-containing protein n=1 Tax=Varroa destructor TaxID=109461 RepID=A0A7M7KIP2_VARDE|nr:fibroleukin-like isoform X1 [Varroa destructor]
MSPVASVMLAILALSLKAARGAPECVSLKALIEVKEQLTDELQATAQQLVPMAIILERIETRLEMISSRPVVIPTQQQQSTGLSNDVFDNRLRSLEGSVSALQRKFDEKLDQSLDRVVSVENKREEQERIFTDILKKILNTVNTVYERLHTSSGENKGRSSSIATSGNRSPPNTQQFLFLQDSMESLSREFKEKLDVLQERLSDSINEVTMMTRLASEKVSYISENMILTEDMQRMGENNPRIVENDMSKVIEEVRDGFKRCTRAVVNAPPMAQVLLQSSSSSNMVATQLPRSTPIPELSFFVGPKRDDCKMSSSVTVPHNCDQLRQAGANCDGPYIVYDAQGKKPMKVMCDMTGGGWTLVLRRGPKGNAQPLSFDRSWASYKYGFGNIQDEFYFGNEYIHKLTETPKMLRVELESFDGDRIILDYENFVVENENDNYRMRVGRYLGNNTRVGNAFRRHNDKQFSTADKVSGPRHCPVDHRAGHWWHSCYSVLLTGEYATPSTGTTKNGIRWSTWKAEPLKAVVLKIREMHRTQKLS